MEIVLGILTFILGVAIARYDAKKSSQESNRHIAELQQDNARLTEQVTEFEARVERLIEITLQIYEDEGRVKLNRDDRHRIIGRMLEMEGSMSGRAAFSVPLSMEHR